MAASRGTPALLSAPWPCAHAPLSQGGLGYDVGTAQALSGLTQPNGLIHYLTQVARELGEHSPQGRRLARGPTRLRASVVVLIGGGGRESLPGSSNSFHWKGHLSLTLTFY